MGSIYTRAWDTEVILRILTPGESQTKLAKIRYRLNLKVGAALGAALPLHGAMGASSRVRIIRTKYRIDTVIVPGWSGNVSRLLISIASSYLYFKVRAKLNASVIN